MIKAEIENILKIKPEIARVEKLEDLTDEFRLGRNPSDLLELMELSDKNILSVALYILGEINVYSDITLQKIIKRLFVLSTYEDSHIRYSTLINIASLTEYINPKELKDIYNKLSKDSDSDISETAIQLSTTGRIATPNQNDKNGGIENERSEY
mgnify:CR=1 FL=1